MHFLKCSDLGEQEKKRERARERGGMKGGGGEDCESCGVGPSRPTNSPASMMDGVEHAPFLSFQFILTCGKFRCNVATFKRLYSSSST